MSAMSDALENSLVDFLFRAQTYTAPSTITIKLFSAAPTDSAGGTEMTATGGYTAQTVSCSLANFYGTSAADTTSGTLTNTSTASAGTGGTTGNVAAINFPVASADWSANPVVAVGVFNGSALMFYGNLVSSKTVQNGDTFTFASAGAASSGLRIQIDN